MFTHKSTSCLHILLKNTGMHATTKRLFDALVELAKIDGYKEPGKVAQCLGESAATITNWKSRGISKQGILKANKLLGIDPRWLESGEGEMLAAGGAVQAPALLDLGLPEGVVRVPVLANAASMGGGLDLCAEDVICGELTLTPQFVAEQLRPVRPGALRFIHGYGDSMFPTFSSGDVLLVDTDMREVRIDGIYVLEAHGRLFIKRVRQRLDGRYEISSDNPTHKTVDTLNGDHQVEVKGRVIWAWNGRKL